MTVIVPVPVGLVLFNCTLKIVPLEVLPHGRPSVASSTVYEPPPLLITWKFGFTRNPADVILGGVTVQSCRFALSWSVTLYARSGVELVRLMLTGTVTHGVFVEMQLGAGPGVTGLSGPTWNPQAGL